MGTLTAADPAALRALSRIFHHRWAAPALARMAATGAGGASVAGLVGALGGSRGAIRAALSALITGGWVDHSRGHAHPLRPEFRLTETGRPLAATLRALLAEAERRGVADVCKRKWTFPITAALGEEQRRYSHIRDALPDVTDRALSLTLRTMVAAGLVRRVMTDDLLPAVAYTLTDAADRLPGLLEGVLAALGGD